MSETSFTGLGLCPELTAACDTVGWNHPTDIQRRTMGDILARRDLIGVAQTGSGKTGAYALPILHHILSDRGKVKSCALVLVPTRELAVQVGEEFTRLGEGIALKVCVVYGGVDMVHQALQLSQRPHVVVATPGRLQDHIEKTKGFRLHKFHYIVMDEADQMLNMDYEKQLTFIMEHLPRQRQTLLFSATMTAKVDKLHRASLHDPVVVMVSASKYQTVDSLQQYYMFIPFCYRYAYLHNYLSSLPREEKVIVFCNTTHLVLRLAHILRILGLTALPLMGKMSQKDRLLSLDKFRDNEAMILVCTDVAQRGLDIPDVHVVVNFQLPSSAKDYIHRVGRTARVGRQGKAITCVTQYDVDDYLKIENVLGRKLEEIEISKEEVIINLERVEAAEREAATRIREEDEIRALNAGQSMRRAKHRRGSQNTIPVDSLIQDPDSQRRMGGADLRQSRRENERLLGTSRQKQRVVLRKKKSTR